MARTAVIAGTATATAGAVQRRQAKKNVAAYEDAQSQYDQTHYVQQPAPAAPAAPAAARTEDKLADLERLGQLKAQGILSEEEFAAEKAKILAQ
jgi:hypothetical protein